MSDSLSELATFLQDRETEIIDFWMRVCEEDQSLGVVSKLTRTEFLDNIPAALNVLYRALRAGAEEFPRTIQQEIEKHGHHRWKQGFTLKELIRDWGHLNRVLIKMIRVFFKESDSHDHRDQFHALDRLSLFMTEAMSCSVRRYDDLKQAEAASLSKDIEQVSEEFHKLTEIRGQMLREAAHDIRGGLSSATMATRVLKSSSITKESFYEVLETLNSGVESALVMLESLLDLSRIEAGIDRAHVVNVDVVETLQHLVSENKILACEKGLELIFEGPDSFIAPTDPTMLRRIAQNLLRNALQHTISGQVKVICEPQEKRWLLQVVDTGEGMQDVLGSPVAQEMDDLNHGVESASAHSPLACKGEGVGLTIVKRLCELLDAGLHLESRAGNGTTFTIEFPLQYDSLDESHLED